MSRLTDKNDSACLWCRDDVDCLGNCHLAEVYERLQHYEDLEEQGRLIKLPCKVGDKVWAIRYGEETDYIVVPMLILEIHIYEHGVFFVPSENIRAFRLKDFGTQVFLTKEEAEAKLAEINNRDAINTEVNYSDAMNVYRELNTHDREKSVSELAELKGTEE